MDCRHQRDLRQAYLNEKSVLAASGISAGQGLTLIRFAGFLWCSRFFLTDFTLQGYNLPQSTDHELVANNDHYCAVIWFP
jgi:hypothetical protein